MDRIIARLKKFLTKPILLNTTCMVCIAVGAGIALLILILLKALAS